MNTITITETAAVMLDALHTGCDVGIWKSNDQAYVTIRIVEVAPHYRRGSEDELIETLPRRFSRTDARLEERVDLSRVRRLDRWTGKDCYMPFRDAVMLIRAGLATTSRREFGPLTITDAGRAIAQTRMGDGVLIKDDVAEPVKAIDRQPYSIGDPEYFQLLEETQSYQDLKLRFWQDAIHFSCSGHLHEATAAIPRSVCRTIAAFLADVGKVREDTTAVFGEVSITLGVRDDAVLRFGNAYTQATACMSKPLAKLLRTYLVELAKGAEEPMAIDPVKIELLTVFEVNPDTMIDDDADDQKNDGDNILLEKDMNQKPSTAMKRMWINQPSTLQPLHHLHGVRVLVAPDTDTCSRAYFLSGDTISMQVPHNALSEGWPETSSPDRTYAS